MSIEQSTCCLPEPSVMLPTCRLLARAPLPSKSMPCCHPEHTFAVVGAQVSKKELLAVQTSKATLNRLLARVRRLTEVRHDCIRQSAVVKP